MHGAAVPGGGGAGGGVGPLVPHHRVGGLVAVLGVVRPRRQVSVRCVYREPLLVHVTTTARGNACSVRADPREIRDTRRSNRRPFTEVVKLKVNNLISGSAPVFSWSPPSGSRSAPPRPS